MEMFKVIIAGGRDFDDLHLMREKCDAALSWKDRGRVEVVSGCARGADSLGRRYARERGYPLKLFPAQWNEHGRSAGPIRNTEMADYADALIAFWDGKSRGTMHMIAVARKKGLKVKVYRY